MRTLTTLAPTGTDAMVHMLDVYLTGALLNRPLDVRDADASDALWLEMAETSYVIGGECSHEVTATHTTGDASDGYSQSSDCLSCGMLVG